MSSHTIVSHLLCIWYWGQLSFFHYWRQTKNMHYT